MVMTAEEAAARSRLYLFRLKSGLFQSIDSIQDVELSVTDRCLRDHVTLNVLKVRTATSVGVRHLAKAILVHYFIFL